MKLSPNFTLTEMLFSETAARAGHILQPSEDIIDNLRHLCIDVLEPLREAVGAPIVISSGWRDPWLNRAIGGSATSEHMSGRAADIRAVGITPSRLCEIAAGMNLPINQLILEFERWCHISVAPIGEIGRREVLTAKIVNGKTIYFPGLVA